MCGLPGVKSHYMPSQYGTGRTGRREVITKMMYSVTAGAVIVTTALNCVVVEKCSAALQLTVCLHSVNGFALHDRPVRSVCLPIKACVCVI